MAHSIVETKDEVLRWDFDYRLKLGGLAVHLGEVGQTYDI